MLTLGVPSLVAAVLALKLTETSKRKLPTTMEDARVRIKHIVKM